MNTNPNTNTTIDESAKADSPETAAVTTANATVNETAVVDKITEYEAHLAAAESLKTQVVQSLEDVIASHQAKLDQVLGNKKARVVKDGAEDRDPTKAVFEEYLEDQSKLDKEGMIRVRDWKSSMRPAVIQFAKENPDYEVVDRGPYRFIKPVFYSLEAREK
ncbi:MAG: hypothetical protein ACOYM3_23795 [Terrimicrobiaceae bacterium]